MENSAIPCVQNLLLFSAGSVRSRFGLREPTASQLVRRNARKVGLQIDDWSAIQHVDTSNSQMPSFPAQHFNRGKANRIWTTWGSSREYSMLAVIGGRLADELISLAPVEYPHDHQVRETLDIF